MGFNHKTATDYPWSLMQEDPLDVLERADNTLLLPSNL